MSASEKDREAIDKALNSYPSLRRKELYEAIATARAEGETAGYAKGRREAFSEAAEIVRTWAQDHECIQPSFGRMAAALRAKADAEAPHE